MAAGLGQHGAEGEVTPVTAPHDQSHQTIQSDQSDRPGQSDPGESRPVLARRRLRRDRNSRRSAPAGKPAEVSNNPPTNPPTDPPAGAPTDVTVAQARDTRRAAGRVTGPSVRQPPARHDADRSERGERGLRGLVGSGPSQVGVSGAMRARDAARPRAADLHAAEAELVIVRRHYLPPDRLPTRSSNRTRTGPHPDDGGNAPEDS